MAIYGFRINVISFYIILLFICTLNVSSQPTGSGGSIYRSHSEQANADSLWNNKPPLYNVVPSSNPTSSEIAQIRSGIEVASRKIREWALQFNYKYPEDHRSIEAINIAISQRVYYWSEPNEAGLKSLSPDKALNIRTDRIAVEKWRSLYPHLRDKYLAASTVTETQKIRFIATELSRFLLGIDLYPSNRNNSKLDLQKVLSMLEESAVASNKLSTSAYKYAARSSGERTSAVNTFNIIEALFINKEMYGLTELDINGFLEKASNSHISDVKKWAKSRMTLYNLSKTPLELKHKTIEGKDFDLKHYRGKIVLIDFWATWCHSCIEKMPKIKKVYDEFHSRGFEVVSVSINGEKDKGRVLKIREEVEFTWPLLLIGSDSQKDKSLYREIWEKYGFNGVPQLLLLDKNGKLVEYQGELLKGKIEEIIAKRLN